MKNQPKNRCSGAGDGTRTRNLLITSQLLYQLSYASAKNLLYTIFATGSSNKKAEYLL